MRENNWWSIYVFDPDDPDNITDEFIERVETVLRQAGIGWEDV